MKDEYYHFSGLDVATGFQTKAKSEGLELYGIANDPAQRGLAGRPVI